MPKILPILRLPGTVASSAGSENINTMLTMKSKVCNAEKIMMSNIIFNVTNANIHSSNELMK